MERRKKDNPHLRTGPVKVQPDQKRLQNTRLPRDLQTNAIINHNEKHTAGMSEDFLDTLELTQTLTDPLKIPDSKQNKNKKLKKKQEPESWELF